MSAREFSYKAKSMGKRRSEEPVMVEMNRLSLQDILPSEPIANTKKVKPLDEWDLGMDRIVKVDNFIPDGVNCDVCTLNHAKVLGIVDGNEKLMCSSCNEKQW